MNTNFCILYLEEGYSGLAIQSIQANYGGGGGGMVSTIGCCIEGSGGGGGGGGKFHLLVILQFIFCDLDILCYSECTYIHIHISTQSMHGCMQLVVN